MSVTTVDTAPLPRVRPAVPGVAPQSSSRPVRAASRRAIRSERRHEVRRRRAYAVGGLAVLAAFVAGTVVVLDVVR